MKPLQFVTLWS